MSTPSNTLSNLASELENLSRMPIAPAIALRHIANEIRGSQYYNREQVVACATEAAEACFEHCQVMGILPPEFKGDYMMQAALVKGMASRIEKIFMPSNL